MPVAKIVRARQKGPCLLFSSSMRNVSASLMAGTSSWRMSVGRKTSFPQLVEVQAKVRVQNASGKVPFLGGARGELQQEAQVAQRSHLCLVLARVGVLHAAQGQDVLGKQSLLQALREVLVEEANSVPRRAPWFEGPVRFRPP